MVASCFRKGVTIRIKVIKGGRYECVSCGTRWPMSDGSKHPKEN